jgi:ElaB/YqjD/DUF883 family membrane-anchored ribosome-binding protein
MSAGTRFDHDPKVSDTHREQAAWGRVLMAVGLRWPEIKQQELREVRHDRDALKKFLSKRVDTNDEEVESIINQYVRQTNQGETSVTNRLEEAKQSLDSAYHRTEQQIASHPGQSVLITFLTGFTLGAVITSMMMRSAPEPTTWEKYGPPRWR